MRMHSQKGCAGGARGQRLGLGYHCAAAQAAAVRTQPAAAQAAVEPASAATASKAPRTSASGPAALVTARAAARLVAPAPAGKPCMRQGRPCTISAYHAQAAAVQQHVLWVCAHLAGAGATGRSASAAAGGLLASSPAAELSSPGFADATGTAGPLLPAGSPQFEHEAMRHTSESLQAMGAHPCRPTCRRCGRPRREIPAARSCVRLAALCWPAA